MVTDKFQPGRIKDWTSLHSSSEKVTQTVISKQNIYGSRYQIELKTGKTSCIQTTPWTIHLGSKFSTYI